MEDVKINEQQAKDLKDANESKAIIFDGKRELSFDNKTVYVRFLTLKEKNIIDKEYSMQYVKMIRAGELPTNREWGKELESRNLWGRQDEDRFEEARRMYMETYKEWYSWPYEQRDSPDFDILDATYAKATLDYMKIYAEKESLFAHTIEKALENDQMIKQVLLCVYQDKDMKEPLFKNRDELETYSNGEAIINLIRDCATFWMGVSERFLEQLPESISGKGNTNSLEKA